MRIIYIDDDNICHAEIADDRTRIETDILDYAADNALDCYKLHIENEEIVGLICFDAERAHYVQQQYETDKEIIDILTGEASINDET